jgi:hypothetical protein
LKPTGVPVNEDQEELSRKVWERSRQMDRLLKFKRVTTAKGYEHKLIVIRCFFIIVDFLGLAAL